MVPVRPTTSPGGWYCDGTPVAVEDEPTGRHVTGAGPVGLLTPWERGHMVGDRALARLGVSLTNAAHVAYAYLMGRAHSEFAADRVPPPGG